MAKRRPQKILFPSGGLSKSTALQAQPPFTSPSLLNVFPWDTSDKSSRGGVRPGTSKFLEQLESGPIRSLIEYREIFSQPNKNLSDYFPWPEGRDLSNVNPFWVAADFTSGLRPPKTYQRKYAVAQGDTREDAAVVTNLP